MRVIPNQPNSISALEQTYANHGWIAYRKPDIAGPAIIAAVQVALKRAMTFGNPPIGATIGGIARSAGAPKARATPNPKAIAKNGQTAVASLSEYSSRATDDSNSPPTANNATLRRLKRSATVPVTRTSNMAGKNSARPINARSISRPVRSYTCLPSAAACRAIPIYKRVLDTNSVRTGRIAQTSDVDH